MSTLMLELIGLLCIFIIIVTYFDSFGVEHIPKEIKAFVKNKNIKTNIFRVQSNDWVIVDIFCIVFIDFMPAGKKLIDYTNCFHQITLTKMMI